MGKHYQAEALLTSKKLLDINEDLKNPKLAMDATNFAEEKQMVLKYMKKYLISFNIKYTN